MQRSSDKKIAPKTRGDFLKISAILKVEPRVNAVRLLPKFTVPVPVQAPERAQLAPLELDRAQSPLAVSLAASKPAALQRQELLQVPELPVQAQQVPWSRALQHPSALHPCLVASP